MPPSSTLSPDSDESKKVYDSGSGHSPTRPNLHVAGGTGLSPKSDAAKAKYGDKMSGLGQIKKGEDEGATGAQDPLREVNAGIAGAAGGAASGGSLYNPEVGAAASTAQRFVAFFWGSGGRKRNTIIGGGGLTAVAVVGIIFILFLPNEVISLMSQLEGHFFAGIELDLEKESDRLVSDYIKHRVLQRLGLQCKSSINLKKCIADGKARFGKVTCADGDEVCKLFNSWDDSDLSGQFADKGITFDTDENGRVFMHGDGLPGGKLDVTDFSKSDAANLFEDKAVETSGFLDTLHRVKENLVVSTGSYLHESFTKLFHGVSFDGDGAGTREDASKDDPQTKQAALQGAEVGETVAADAAVTADAVTCLTDTSCNPTARTAGTTDAATDPDAGTPKSATEIADNQALDAAATKFGSAKLADLIKNYNDLKAKGVDALADAVAEAISGVAGVDVSKAAVKDLIDKFSVVGWIQMAAQAISFIHGADTKLKALNYSIHAAPFIAEFVAYASESDKQKSGCTNSSNGNCQNDLTMIGSFAKGLSANGSTATSSPFVQYSTNPNNTTQTAASAHTDLMQNHMALNDYSNGITEASKGLNAIPGFNFLADLASLVSKIINGVLGPINWLVSGFAGVTGLNDLLGKAIGPLLIVVTEHMFQMPNLLNLSGKDRGSILAIGNHLTASKAGEALGGKRVSPATVAAMTNEQENANYQQFREQPLFARMFSADTPYSFVSRLSLDIPTTFSTMLQTSFSSLLENPLGKLFGSFSTILRPGHAFAAATAAVSPDGVSDNLVPPSDSVFSTDSEAYLKQHNCTEQQQKDYPDWNKKVATDPDTGQVYHTTTNGCLLMERASESMGALAGSGG